MLQDFDLNNFWQIVSKPDNIPVLGLYILLAFFTGWGLLQGNINDRRRAAGQPLIEEAGDKVHTWPYLTRIEFLALIIVMVLLTVWSVTIDAPLEEPAEPSQTPNPSKAPWYFLGLQEMLVYFDPWFAGVVLPGLIVVGLIMIPYVDPNPKASGYYTIRQRPFALFVFFFGFFLLWCAQIFIGTFLRGPGWNLFSPFETWDPHKVVFANNIDLSNVIGQVISGVLGAVGVADTTRLRVLAAFDSKAPLGVLLGAAVVLGYLGLGPMSYLVARRVTRRQEVLHPESGRLREDATVQTVDAIVGTDPTGANPMRILLDVFVWSIKLPLWAFLGLLGIPTLGVLGQLVSLAGVIVYAVVQFSSGFGTGSVLAVALLAGAWLWLRRAGNWERVRYACLEAIPQAVVNKVEELGLIRYVIVSGLFLIMFGVPAKMVLRWTFAVKYVWVVPGVINI